MPSEQILDTVVLRVMSFAHPDGIDIMLRALRVSQVRFPAEVYNRDEDDASLTRDDPALSEYARGMRYARDQAARSTDVEQMRYRTWLENAGQLHLHFRQGHLIIDSLTFAEILNRDEVMNRFGIGRGEAACLVLAQRYGAIAVFVSSDRLACKAAQTLSISYMNLEEMLEGWVARSRPNRQQVEALIQGMRSAKFGLKEEVLRRLLDPPTRS